MLASFLPRAQGGFRISPLSAPGDPVTPLKRPHTWGFGFAAIKFILVLRPPSESIGYIYFMAYWRCHFVSSLTPPHWIMWRCFCVTGLRTSYVKTPFYSISALSSVSTGGEQLCPEH